MTWEEAKARIEQHILPGLKLEEDSAFRFVIWVETEPEWACRVRVGELTEVRVSMKMLEDIFHAVQREGGVYRRNVVPRAHRHKIEVEGTYVHVIGQIFHKAGISGPRQGHKYRFV
jgi:hypothetical protein